MATNDIEATKIKIRRDTSDNWATINPVLSEGEIGIEWVDDFKKQCYIKVGNGVDHYADLEYFGGSLSDGIPTPEPDYNFINEETLPTINSIKVKGALTLNDLGIQPLGSYVTSSEFSEAISGKADKANVYSIQDIDNMLEAMALPDMAGNDGKYLKVSDNKAVWSEITEDLVSHEFLDQALEGKVDNETLAELDVPGLRSEVTTLSGKVAGKVDTIDFVRLEEEVDQKADVGDVYNKTAIDNMIQGFATEEQINELRTTKASAADLTNHVNNVSNPHHVTLPQLGLSQDYYGTSPASLPISDDTQAALDNKQDAFSTGYGVTIENGVLINTLPNIQSDWLASEGNSAAILNKPELATVATTGSYNDLTDRPTIVEYVLPPAEQEVLGGIKLGEDFRLDEEGHLKANNSGISYNDLLNKPSIIDINGDEYILTDHMTAADLNLASLTVAKAIDQHLQQQIDDINARAELPPIDGHDGDYLKVDGDTIVWSSMEGDFVTHSEFEEAMDGKADKGTTLADYGITNAYTKTEVNDKLALKADKSTVNSQLALKQDISNMKQTLDGFTPEEEATYYPSIAAVKNAVSGSVKSVNGALPDASGDVTVYAAVIKDWTIDPQYTFTIVATPVESTIIIDGSEQSSVTVDDETTVTWEVSCQGYVTQTGSHTMNGDDYTEEVTLVAEI